MKRRPTGLACQFMLYFTLQNQRCSGAAVAASGNFCSVLHDPTFYARHGLYFKLCKVGYFASLFFELIWWWGSFSEQTNYFIGLTALRSVDFSGRRHHCSVRRFSFLTLSSLAYGLQCDERSFDEGNLLLLRLPARNAVSRKVQRLLRLTRSMIQIPCLTGWKPNGQLCLLCVDVILDLRPRKQVR